MDTNQHDNSDRNNRTNGSLGPSERQKLLSSSLQLFAKELDDEGLRFWIDFLKQFSIAELRYAFDHWNTNGHWFPKPKDIGDLCAAFRIDQTNAEFPVGCERCDWTGFYKVHENPNRLMAPCPCRQNPALRTRCTKKLATREEIANMWAQFKKFCDGVTILQNPKHKQISGLIPTTLELAKELAERGKKA